MILIICPQNKLKAVNTIVLVITQNNITPSLVKSKEERLMV